MPDAPPTKLFTSNEAVEKQRWEEQTLHPALRKAPEKPIGTATGVNVDAAGQARFTTISGVPVERLYTETDLPGEWEANGSAPGEPPYTRGIHPKGYRGKLWTMRQFSGFASPEETNAALQISAGKRRRAGSRLPLTCLR